MITRRHFLSGAGAGIFLSGYPVHGFTKNAINGRIIVLLLEGGMDGLLAVPPVGDDNLYKQRKDLVASNPLKLNPLFGIHPNFKNFSLMLASDQASIIHATSFPYVGRSHFKNAIFYKNRLARTSDGYSTNSRKSNVSRNSIID